MNVKKSLVWTWLVLILLCEWLIPNWSLLPCSFHLPFKVLVIADPQLTDAYSYKQSAGPLLWLTQFFSDIYMHRNYYRVLQWYLDPDAVLFVGDLMDGARHWKDSTYLRHSV